MKRWLSIALNLLGLALFALIIWWGGEDAWQQLLNGDWRWLLTGLLIYGVVGVLSGVRLRLSAHVAAERDLASWRRFYHLSMTARALGLVLPRSVSTLGGKSLGMRTMGLPLHRGLWAILIDNGLDIMLLGTLSIPSILFLQGTLTEGGFLLWAGVITAVDALIVWWLFQPGRLDFLFRWLHRIPFLVKRLKLDEETAVLPLPTPIQAIKLLLYTAAINSTIALTAFAIGKTIGLPLDWVIYILLHPITQLSLMAAIAPGGLGTYDFTWLGLLILLTISQTDANAFAVAHRIYITVFVLIWAGVSALLVFTTEKSVVSNQ